MCWPMIRKYQRRRSVKAPRQFGAEVAFGTIVLSLIAAGPSDPGGPGTLRVGDPAPPLELEGLLQVPEGSSADWEHLRGQVVVLEFWGTWCPPCVAAIPHLNEVAEQVADRDVQFISITFESERTVRRFLEERQMRSWIGLDMDRSVVDAYGVHAWPTTVLVDREGRVAGITDPSQVTAEVLQAMLAGRPPGVSPRKLPKELGEPSAEPPPIFELSLRPATGPGRGATVGPGRLEYRGFTLIQLFRPLYDTPETRLHLRTELPEDRLDVRILSALNDRELVVEKRLLRQVLETMFGFTTRHEVIPIDVYVLSAPSPPGESLVKAAVEAGSWTTRSGPGMLEAIGLPFEDLAGILEGMLGRPVIDEAGLAGYYDVHLRARDAEPESIVEAVREQLGLELSPERRDIELLVVEEHRP